MATKKTLLYMGLKQSDVAGRYAVVVNIEPDMPQDDMQKAQLAAAYRAPGVDGRPLMDDQSIRELLGFEHPDLIAHRTNQQLLLSQSQEIAKIVQAAAEYDWKDENKKMVETAEKILNPEGLPDIKPEQVQQLLALLTKHAGGAQGLDAMLAQAGTPGAVMAAGGPPGAPGVVPGGPQSAVMPSQLSMTPEEALPNPVVLPGKQARRGKPQNK